MVLAISLYLAACQQEVNPVEEQLKLDQLVADAGRIHNEMISYYYDNRLETNANPDGKLDELLNLSWEYLDKNGYDVGHSKETRQLIEEKLNVSGLKSVTENNYSIDTSRFISHLSKSGMYSDHFQKEVKKILSLAHSHDDREVVKQYVNTTFSAMKFQENNDMKGQQLYVNIFNGSFDFWESFEGSNLKSSNLRRSSWVIINDGIGGILGSIFGPIGSIVTATAFSVGTNEEINR